MAVLTALALVFGAGRSAGDHPLGGRLGCVAGLPAGVEPASRAALCVFTAWISLRSCAASRRAAAAVSRDSSRPPSSSARLYGGLSRLRACIARHAAAGAAESIVTAKRRENPRRGMRQSHACFFLVKEKAPWKPARVGSFQLPGLPGG